MLGARRLKSAARAGNPRTRLPRRACASNVRKQSSGREWVGWGWGGAGAGGVGGRGERLGFVSGQACVNDRGQTRSPMR